LKKTEGRGKLYFKFQAVNGNNNFNPEYPVNPVKKIIFKSANMLRGIEKNYEIRK